MSGQSTRKRRKMAKKPKEGGSSPLNASLYPDEHAKVQNVQLRGAAWGIVIDKSKAVRLLIRAAKVEELTRAQFEEIAAEVGARRRSQ